MTSKEIREKFFKFFEEKGHKIVDSAPIVAKDDPSLMFINAGMNPFKDFFLGNKVAIDKRVANTQKCLRVSGKHNDLEEVGRDSYHHTMFEMLGNWSFGDYFKTEAINWAWELLTKELQLDPNRLYASVFEGSETDGLEADHEAVEEWSKLVPKDRILYFDKKDNFWEMGETGPCGPCSEIHIDLRSDEERAKIDGATLVNMDHPLVIEIWNLVFIQYNRNASGSLEELPDKHVDTGMGLERLTMALQQVKSNYDTDLFSNTIAYIEQASGKKYEGSYTEDNKVDISMRVLADHVRAVSFAIADGALPSSTGAGYVIRRILRRAVRYYYSFLDIKKPFLYELVKILSDQFAHLFTSLKSQQEFVAKVVLEEEKSFLKTLADGLQRIESFTPESNTLDGNTTFELYDTFGFPIDLTRLIAEEKGWTIDEKGFDAALQAQKERSRADAKKELGDWQIVKDTLECAFVGYDQLTLDGANLTKYREMSSKGKKQFQLVLNQTPFYPEGGGQVGDSGTLHFGDETIQVFDTVKENDLIIHLAAQLPSDIKANVKAEVNERKRRLTENNHSATHLMHAALREILGKHVEQKGSLVKDQYLRFDFSHFQKLTDEELQAIEKRVNQKIRENISLEEARSIPIEEAKQAGAMMLFGEKYGEEVRMITFDPSYSRELCGGCHVPATGVIGQFKITNESSVAAGVRRIEAITALAAENFVNERLELLAELHTILKNPKDLKTAIQNLQKDHKSLLKKIDGLQNAKSADLKSDLKAEAVKQDDKTILIKKLTDTDPKQAKNLVFQLEKELENAIVAIGVVNEGKAQLLVAVNKSLNDQYQANDIIKEIAPLINGGGGGQSHFASAGGSNPDGIDQALEAISNMLK